MPREYFRIIIGASIIVVHAICYVLIMFQKGDYFTAAQRVDLGLLFVPVTSAYFVAVVRSAIEEQGRKTLSRTVNLNYCVIVSLVTILALGGLVFR